MTRDQRSDEDKDVLAVAAALLQANGNQKLRQDELAKSLGVTQPDVSRALKRAYEKGWLSVDEKKVGESLMEKAKQKYFSFQDLQIKLDSICKHGSCKLHVVHVGKHEDYSEASRMFGVLAASRVHALLHNAQVVGCTWGRTLAHLVDGMKGEHDRGHTTRINSVRHVVPICGEPVYLRKFDRDQRYNSSFLAAELQLALIGKHQQDSPTLHAVPAYVSRKEDRHGVKSFVCRVPGFKEIFGSKGLVQKIDTVLTGVGVSTLSPDTTGTFLKERVEQEKNLKSDRLSKLTAGDFGGLLIPQVDVTPAEQKEIDALNEGWMGMTVKLFEQIVRRAKRDTRPGVILLARGKEKAGIVRAVIEHGLVSSLVISDDLAMALDSQLEGSDAMQEQ